MFFVGRSHHEALPRIAAGLRIICGQLPSVMGGSSCETCLEDRVLNTGTRIEDRWLLEAQALVKCLAFDAVTAWPEFS